MPGGAKNESKGIFTWPEDERPRERLLSRGPHARTDAELTAILLRPGVRGKSAVELGHELIKRFGSPIVWECSASHSVPNRPRHRPHQGNIDVRPKINTITP